MSESPIQTPELQRVIETSSIGNTVSPIGLINVIETDDSPLTVITSNSPFEQNFAGNSKVLVNQKSNENDELRKEYFPEFKEPIIIKFASHYSGQICDKEKAFYFPKIFCDNLKWYFHNYKQLLEVYKHLENKFCFIAAKKLTEINVPHLQNCKELFLQNSKEEAKFEKAFEEAKKMNMPIGSVIVIHGQLHSGSFGNFFVKFILITVIYLN